MLLTIFINILLAIITQVFTHFPPFLLPVTFVTGIVTMIALANSFSYVFPINLLLLSVTLVISVELALLGFRLFKWLIRKIPGVK